MEILYTSIPQLLYAEKRQCKQTIQNRKNYPFFWRESSKQKAVSFQRFSLPEALIRGQMSQKVSS